MNDLTPLNKVFWSERLRFCLEPWNPLKPLWAGCRKLQNLFWKCNCWIEKNRIAEMVDFFTKPSFKNDQKQSHEGGSLEARKPLNKMTVSPPLNKVSGFLVLKLWWLNSFLNSFSNLINSCIYYWKRLPLIK